MLPEPIPPPEPPPPQPKRRHVQIDIVTFKWFDEVKNRLIEVTAVYLGTVYYQCRGTFHPPDSFLHDPKALDWANSFTTGYREALRYYDVADHWLRQHVVEHCWWAKSVCTGGNPPRRLPVAELTQTQPLAGEPPSA